MSKTLFLCHRFYTTQRWSLATGLDFILSYHQQLSLAILNLCKNCLNIILLLKKIETIYMRHHQWVSISPRWNIIYESLGVSMWREWFWNYTTENLHITSWVLLIINYTWLLQNYYISECHVHMLALRVQYKHTLFDVFTLNTYSIKVVIWKSLNIYNTFRHPVLLRNQKYLRKFNLFFFLIVFLSYDEILQFKSFWN